MDVPHFKSVASHTVLMAGLVICKRRKVICIHPATVRRAVPGAYDGLTTVQIVEAIWKACLDGGEAAGDFRVIIDPGEPSGEPPCGCVVWETYAFEQVKQ